MSKIKKSKNQYNPIPAFENAYGEIPYGMTNDYMFRAVLQSNNIVLRGLICALLHLEERDVQSVKVTNTEILGDALEDKEMRLDIDVTLNDNTFINLEMQVSNELNWPNRSITYLCRSVDQLSHGDEYSELKPVIHIGFLDYTLFKEYPEFYATYKLINVNNHHIYSDKMTLSVVDLTRIDLATEEDKAYHIDEWAALFKAKTWEELKAMAAKSNYFKEATETIYRMSADERIRKICRDREEHRQDIRNYQRSNAEKDRIIAEKEEVIAEKDLTIQQLTAELERLRNQ